MTKMPSPWKAVVLTLFPDMFPGPLATSVIGNALKQNIWQCKTINIRDFGLGKHRQVDDTPAGGGPGMVMRADVLAAAIDTAQTQNTDLPVIYLSAQGRPFTQSKAHSLAQQPGAIFLSGRFEGIDQRVLNTRNIEEVSLGDFVLTGGELAAMTLIDATVRLLPGVLGAEASLNEESFQNDLLEYPQYTKPRLWEEQEIPETLLSGDHQKIAQWRHQQAITKTQDSRPDLWQRYQKRQTHSDKDAK